MSSSSAIDGAGSVASPARPDQPDRIRRLGLAFVLLYAATAQLDAVANRISAGSPVSLVSAGTIALVGAALLVAAASWRGQPDAGRGHLGFRLIVGLFLWAVACWTVSAHLGAGATYLGKLGVAIAPALCVVLIVDRPSHIRAVVWAIMLASAASAVIVLIEARTGTRLVATALAAVSADFDGVARSSGGSDQNPTTAAQMLMVGVVLAAALLIGGERRGRLLLIGITLVGGAALALMSARSAILGAGAGAAMILFSLRRSRLFPLALGGAALFATALALLAPHILIARFAAIDDFGQDPTLFRRLTYLRIGLDLVEHSPLWGVGPGNFPLYFVGDAYRYMPGRELFPRELHNTYLDTAAEYGLIGLALFAAILVRALRSAKSGWAAGASPTLARTSFAIAAALVALLVGCFFMPHKDMRYLWLMIALAMQCGVARDREAEIR